MRLDEKEIQYIKKYGLKDIEAIEPVELDSIKPILGGKVDKFIYNLNVINERYKIEKNFEFRFETEDKKYEVIGFEEDSLYKKGFQPGILHVKIKTGDINRIYQIFVQGDIFSNFMREFFAKCEYSAIKYYPDHTNNMFFNFFNTIAKCGYYFPAKRMDSKIWERVRLKLNSEVHSTPDYVKNFYNNFESYNAVYIKDRETDDKHYGFIGPFIKDSFREDLSTIICWDLKHNPFDDNTFFREYFDGENDSLTKIDFSLLPKEELKNFINIHDGLELSTHGKHLY